MRIHHFQCKAVFVTAEKSLKYVTQTHQKAQNSDKKVLKCVALTPQPNPTLPSQAHSSLEHPAVNVVALIIWVLKITPTKQQQRNFSPIIVTNTASIILLYRCANIPIWWYFRSPKTGLQPEHRTNRATIPLRKGN